MSDIALTQGYYATVDPADFYWISRWKWCANSPIRTRLPYAVRGIRICGKHTRILMHRLIAGASADEVVGHINGNSLDNRRGNLLVNGQELTKLNRTAARAGVSKYKHVSWLVGMGMWCVSYRHKTYGYFISEIDAARVANWAVYQQERSKLNVIPWLSEDRQCMEPPAVEGRVSRDPGMRNIRRRSRNCWSLAIGTKDGKRVHEYFKTLADAVNARDSRDILA